MSAVNVAFSGSVPEKYDECLGPLLFEPYALDICKRVKEIPGNAILEIACGTGRVTSHLSAQFPDAKITATDLNPDMISIAKKRISSKNTEWMTADVQQLPFADESFDIIVCQFGFMFVPDKPKAFAETFRVLKKGGQLLFNTWDKIENNGPAKIANEAVTEFFKGDPPTFYKIPFSMYDADEIKTLLANAGYKEVSVENVKKEGRNETAKNTAVGFIEGNPIYVEIINKDPSSIQAIELSLTNKLIQQFGDNPLICELSAFVCKGIK
ncbi:MAG: class I SAM-dependent methyltransferase [Sphingobacteriales bacterium]